MGFFRCWDGAVQKNSPRNPPSTPPSGSSVCKQRGSRRPHGSAQRKQVFSAIPAGGAKEIVMKLGKRGCLISDGGILREIPSFDVRAVDSTGAGDAFTAVFLQARLRGWSTLEAALAANAAGAAAACRVGAGATLSDVAGILRVLRKRGKKGTWEKVRLQILSRVQTMRSF